MESTPMNTASKTNELRKTGITIIGDLPWGTHFCYFYETKEDLLETQVPYFKAGLEAREFCVWVVSPVLKVEEAKSALQEAVPDLGRHLAEGALEIHSHDEWYLRDGKCDPLRVLQSWREKIIQSSAKGYAGLRAAGDGGWIGSDEWMVFSEYEKQVSALVADQRSIILCTYPLATSPGDQVFDVAHIHRVAVARRHGTWEMIETPELKEAKAEIRRLNEELERKVEERTRELAATNEALKSEIAERALAEAALKQGEDHLGLVIDTIPTMVWRLRPDGAVDFVNQRWVDYTGVSFNDAIREPNAIVHPEDLPRVLKRWNKDMAAGQASEDEMRLRRADGEYRWFLVRTVPQRDEQGNIVEWYGASSDIEDRKQAEMQSRVLIESIPQQIWSTPPDGHTDYCNERWRSYTGLTLEDLRGYGWQRMLHPEDQDQVSRAWQESVATGTPYEQEERHRGADGTYRWFLSRAVPLRDADGRIVRWYGTNTDIEDRKRAEEALRESEKLFAAFMDHLPGFAWMKDLEGRYVWINKKEAELDVYRDGAIGKTDADLWPEEIASAYRVNDDQVVTTRKAVQTVEPSLSKGERSYMLVTKFPIFDQNGSVVMVAGAGVDITDLTEAEVALNAQALRYKTLMATSTDSIYILDENGDLQEANAAFLRRRGYTPAEVKGLNVADWDAQWNREEIKERIQEVLESSAMFETRHRCKDGSVFDVEVCATGVQIAGEQLFFCVTRDISERKQAEDRLRRSEEKFKTLFGLAPVGISVVDRQHKVVDANPALEKIVRLSRKELMSGKHPHRVILRADGTPMPPQEFPSERAMKENRAVHDEIAVVMENGEILWVEVTAAPLALPDASAVVITQDIMERKRAEEELKREKEILAKIFNDIPVMIGFVSADGGVKIVNPEWERTMGWTLKELEEQKVDIFTEAYPDLSYRKKVLDFVAAATGDWADLKIKVRDGHAIDAACAVVRLSDGTKIAIAQDITERKRAAKELGEANQQLRTLSRHLFHLQEEERRHLARELHDEIGQNLTAAKINLNIIARDVPASATGRLDDSIQLLDRLLMQVRQLSLGLRPPLLDELGLVPTLRWLVDQQAQRAGLRMTFTATVDGLELDPAIQTSCFRVAQEAITNIIRHSGAKNVAVELRHDAERLWLSVRDDGAGFDPAAIQQSVTHSSLGLVSMKERALLVRGGLEVHSAPGQGAEIRAWFPLLFPEQDSSAQTP
jgi:PAS domain S-box-containing protein